MPASSKMFSTNCSFWPNPWKFYPAKVLCYMVHVHAYRRKGHAYSHAFSHTQVQVRVMILFYWTWVATKKMNNLSLTPNPRATAHLSIPTPHKPQSTLLPQSTDLEEPNVTLPTRKLHSFPPSPVVRPRGVELDSAHTGHMTTDSLSTSSVPIKRRFSSTDECAEDDLIGDIFTATSNRSTTTSTNSMMAHPVSVITGRGHSSPFPHSYQATLVVVGWVWCPLPWHNNTSLIILY